MSSSEISNALSSALYGAPTTRTSASQRSVTPDIVLWNRTHNKLSYRHINTDTNIDCITSSLMSLLCDTIGGVEHTVLSIERTGDYAELDFRGLGMDTNEIFDLFSSLSDKSDVNDFREALLMPALQFSHYVIRSVKNHKAVEVAVEVDIHAHEGRGLILSLLSETDASEQDHTSFAFSIELSKNDIFLLGTLSFYSFHNTLSVRMLSAGVHISDIDFQATFNGNRFLPSGVLNSVDYGHVKASEIGEFGKVYSYIKLLSNTSKGNDIYIRLAKSVPHRVVNGIEDTTVAFRSLLGEDVAGREIVEMAIPFNVNGVRSFDDIPMFVNGLGRIERLGAGTSFSHGLIPTYCSGDETRNLNYPNSFFHNVALGEDEEELGDPRGGVKFPYSNIASVLESANSHNVDINNKSVMPPLVAGVTSESYALLDCYKNNRGTNTVSLAFSPEVASAIFTTVFCSGYNISSVTALNAVITLSVMSRAFSDSEHEEFLTEARAAVERADERVAEAGLALVEMLETTGALSNESNEVYSQKIQKNKKVMLSKNFTKENVDDKMPFVCASSRMGSYIAEMVSSIAARRPPNSQSAIVAFVLDDKKSGKKVDASSTKMRDFIKSVVLSEAVVEDFPFHTALDKASSLPIVINVIDGEKISRDTLLLFSTMLNNALPVQARVYDGEQYHMVTKKLVDNSVFGIDEKDAMHMFWYDFKGVLLSPENSRDVFRTFNTMSYFEMQSVGEKSIAENTALLGGTVSRDVSSGIVIALPSSYYSSAVEAASSLVVALENAGMDITSPAVVAIFCNDVPTDIEKVFGEQWRVIPAPAISKISLGERYGSVYSYGETEIPKNQREMPLVRHVDWDKMHREFTVLFGGKNADVQYSRYVVRDSEAPVVTTSFLAAAMIALAINSYHTTTHKKLQNIMSSFSNSKVFNSESTMSVVSLVDAAINGGFNKSLLNMSAYTSNGFLSEVVKAGVFENCDYQEVIADDVFTAARDFLVSKSCEIRQSHDELEAFFVCDAVSSSTRGSSESSFKALAASFFAVLGSMSTTDVEKRLVDLCDKERTSGSYSALTKYDWAVSYLNGKKMSKYEISRCAGVIKDDMTTEQYCAVFSFISKWEELVTLMREIHTNYQSITSGFVARKLLAHDEQLFAIMRERINSNALALHEAETEDFKKKLKVVAA